MKTTILIFALALSQIAAAKGPQRDRIGNGIGEALELATNSSNQGPLTLLEKLILAFEQSEGNIPDLAKLRILTKATWIMAPQKNSLGTRVDLGEKSFTISSQFLRSVNLTGNPPPNGDAIYRLQNAPQPGVDFVIEFRGALAPSSSGMTSKLGGNDRYFSNVEVRQFGKFVLIAVTPGTDGACLGPQSQGTNHLNGYCGIAYLEMP